MSDHHFIINPAMPEYWTSAFDVVPFPIYVVDVATHELINVNRTMLKRTGDTDGKKCYQAIYGRSTPCSFCAINSMRAQPQPIGKTVIFEHFNESDDRWYQLQETLISWFDGRLAKYSIAVDVSQLKEAQNALAEAHADLSLKNRELERLTVTDSLTGISNRRLLTEQLDQEVARACRYGEPLSALLIDVDRFKQVNDSHGHQMGDLVLTGIADLFRRRVRKADCVGRWGGEEFMVICPNTPSAEAVVLAEEIRQAVAALEFPLVGRITCSIGVAEYCAGEAPEKMVARADQALYGAKTLGRDHVQFAEFG